MSKDLITMNNVNIQPLMESLVELVKDKKATGELDDLINAKLPEKTSADWKLIDITAREGAPSNKKIAPTVPPENDA